MSGQTVLMPTPKKSKPKAAKPDESYRKSFKPARIRGALAEVATSRAAELAQDFTQYVNDAVRMRLENEGLWPPKKPEGGK